MAKIKTNSRRPYLTPPDDKTRLFWRDIGPGQAVNLGSFTRLSVVRRLQRITAAQIRRFSRVFLIAGSGPKSGDFWHFLSVFFAGPKLSKSPYQNVTWKVKFDRNFAGFDQKTSILIFSIRRFLYFWLAEFFYHPVTPRQFVTRFHFYKTSIQISNTKLVIPAKYIFTFNAIFAIIRKLTLFIVVMA